MLRRAACLYVRPHSTWRSFDCLNAVSDLQLLHDMRHATLPGLFAEQGSFAISLLLMLREPPARASSSLGVKLRYVDRQPAQLFARTVSIQIICQQNVRNGSNSTNLNDIYVRFPTTYMLGIPLHIR